MAKFDNSKESTSELEEAWQLINDTYYEGLDLDADRPIVSEDPLGKLAFFMEFDLYPPPELLMQIVNVYQSYIAQEGSVNLEESFYGKPIKGLGNYSGRKSKSEDVKFLDVMLQIESVTQNVKTKSQIEIAEEYLLNKGSDEDPEHLLRKLRRHKAKSKKQT
ncbi:hypothetical protein BCU12_22015 [Vibrio sp. 10N.261.55.A7]|nr:hypothetical protein BCU12_22015 [Vibrio sp. 10N.261.55.A7]